MSDTAVISLIAPIILILMMLGMGLTLSVADFSRLTREPKPVLLGISAQVVGLPIIAVLLIQLTGLSGELAVGMLVLAACPGGPGSNTLTFICRGNAALSVTLTALSSCIAIITIPFITNLGLDWYLQTARPLSVTKTLLLVMGITLVPLALGMLSARMMPAFAQKAEPHVRICSIIGLLILVIVIFYRARHQLPEFIDQIGLTVSLLCAVTISVGFLLSKLAKLDHKNQKTIAIEVGIQNSELAIVVANTLLDSAVMAIPAAMYSPVMISASALFVLHYAINKQRLQQVA